MSTEENLIKNRPQTDKNKDLKQELEDALELLKTYEKLILELKLENSNNLKKFTHELANPLQILSMTIESVIDHPPQDMSAALERMKRAADNMTQIIQAIRKLKSASTPTSTSSGIKVV